ncbi:aldehyde dehydrogenase family protein [Sulfobacillus harzensis]|uniref:Aldehyde dehydrogenase family protein n=1 Tax=Sulfobacillus harzensis TaxID=2729629 RepID=A0A7Y0L5L3_9FIRM|nr:aldehyde dehydrogenase family protein [Sulfobacillus harzensis]NMP23650.1 aldehyde dehydrogenase family protein [Sulfobacillus harzensis]
MTRYNHFIGGDWVAPATKTWFEAIDPSNGQAFAELPRGSTPDVDAGVLAARAAFPAWAARDALERGRILSRIAQRITREADNLTHIESIDTGKPLSQARADVLVAARYFEFYAGAVDKFGGETIPVPGPFLNYTLREPLGVVAHIIPWNYPLQIGSRAIAAPLAVGNTVVLKPAEEASVSLFTLARICAEEGVPPGVVNVIAGIGEEAGAPLAAHPGINHVTFTGSLEVGRRVAQAAAANVVPVTMELGGKSPHIVFSSADLDRAVPIILRSFIQNAGQTCSAGSRILVDNRIKRELVERLTEEVGRLSIGPGPSDPDLGPLISERQKERVQHYIQLARQRGATIREGLLGTESQGFFVAATLLDGVLPDNPVFHEEIFGPVASITGFSSESEAVELANATEYGLVSAVWTKDVAQAHRVATKVQTGQVFINSYGAGGGVEMPFGGYRHSGYGREKGMEALYHYTQVKNVAVFMDGQED